MSSAAHEEPLELDATTPHLALRYTLSLREPPEPVRLWLTRAAALDARPAHDPHRSFLAHLDGPQHADPERAAAYLSALTLLRAHADGAEPLTLELLQRAQGIVLGLPGLAPLRATHAYARGGAHRYPARPDLEALLRGRLAAWLAEALDPYVLAAGLYLDAAFVHPFEDGNARLARLCFDWALWRGARALPRFEDLLRVPKSPGDAEGFWRLVRVGAASAAGLARARSHR